MVSERVPLAIRSLAIFFAFVAVATAGSSHAKSCHFGDETYNSTSQINFLLAAGVLVMLLLTARILALDVKKIRSPSVNALVVFDGVFLVFTLSAAIGVALSPAGGTICTGDNALKELLQEACDVNCSNVVGSVAMMFLTFVCFLVSILFTTNVIPTTATASAARAEEDFTFGETGTPRTRKLQQNNNTTVGQV